MTHSARKSFRKAESFIFSETCASVASPLFQFQPTHSTGWAGFFERLLRTPL